MRGRVLLPILALLPSLAAAPAAAVVEHVVIRSGGKDDAVIERANGDRYRLDLRQSCQAVLGLSGRQALVWSQDGALGPGTRLLIPELDTDCPVFGADSIGHVKPRREPQAPLEALSAVRAALERLGRPVGVIDPVWNDDVAESFRDFREAHQLDTTPQGVHRALLALAIEVMQGRQATGTGMKISQAIDDDIDVLTDWLTRGGNVCADETFVRAKSDDKKAVQLGDGTVWQLDQDSYAGVAAWGADDGVLACTGRLVNTHTGAMVHATRTR
ncbi:MAG TPA: hypothetical protein VFK69_01735 [Candidatus Eisenbacteria bacterium]|nr:hypothetical protein [Candidatus Eisenbacteria bacterium]